MFKILHTADWHLGKWLENVSRLPEQKEVLDEICQIADREGPDVVIIAGDLFDTFNPSAEAQELFYRTLRRLGDNGRRPVIAIAGNHDSPDRIEAPDHLARECGIIFIGYPNSIIPECQTEGGLTITKSKPGFLELRIKDNPVPLRVLSTAYANEFRLRTFLGAENREEELRQLLQHNWNELAEQYCDQKGVNILVAHLFFQKKGAPAEAEPDDEKPILHVGGAQEVYTENIPSQIQYAAFGHLHRFRIVDTEPCPAVYAGSPVSYSFAEAGQEKFVAMVTIAPGKSADVTKIPLTKGKKLLRQRFEDIDDAVVWLSSHQEALVEITMVTDDFLSSRDRRRLNDAHPGIINIVPEVKNRPFLTISDNGAIDLNKNMEELFTDYFHHKHGQAPDNDIMSLFREVLGTTEE